MPSATAAAIPLARLLVADSEPLKQTFSGAGSTREDLRSVLPMYIEVKGWKDIDGSSIESLISCLFDGKVLGGSNLTWAEFNIGLREIELEDPQQAADEDDDNEASTGQPEVDEAIAEREPGAAKLPEAGATAQLEVAYLTTATSKLQKMVSAVKNSCSARHHSAAAVQASAPSAKPQQTEAEFLREMTARINHMASRQRTVLARVQDGASPSSTTVAKSLANALSSDGGRDALKAIFDSLDANGDGRISKREWGKGIRKHELSLTKYFGISLKGIGQKFSEMDADGSQDLSFEEFASGAMSLNAAIRISEAMGNESGLAEFEQLFNALDKGEPFRHRGPWPRRLAARICPLSSLLPPSSLQTATARSAKRSGRQVSSRTRSSSRSTLVARPLVRLVRHSRASMRTEISR